jgi:hypothetical protein
LFLTFLNFIIFVLEIYCVTSEIVGTEQERR